MSTCLADIFHTPQRPVSPRPDAVSFLTWFMSKTGKKSSNAAPRFLFYGRSVSTARLPDSDWPHLWLLLLSFIRSSRHPAIQKERTSTCPSFKLRKVQYGIQVAPFESCAQWQVGKERFAILSHACPLGEKTIFCCPLPRVIPLCSFPSCSFPSCTFFSCSFPRRFSHFLPLFFVVVAARYVIFGALLHRSCPHVLDLRLPLVSFRRAASLE